MGNACAYKQQVDELRDAQSLTIYGDYLSPKTRALLSLCNMAGQQQMFILVDTLKGEHKMPLYTKENPTSSVPMIIHANTKIIGEGACVFHYLGNKLPSIREVFYHESQTDIADVMFSHFKMTVRKTTESLINRVLRAKTASREEQQPGTVR